MGDGLFAPNQTTNREQIATMVNRAIQYIKAETGINQATQSLFSTEFSY